MFGPTRFSKAIPPSPPPPPPPMLEDSFTGPNGTLLTAHTPDVGGPWLTESTSCRITSNEARAVSADQNHVVLPTNNVRITAIVTATGDMVFDTAVAIKLRADPLVGEWRVSYFSSGSITLLCFNPFIFVGAFAAPAPNVPRELVIECEDEEFRIEVDGAPITTYALADEHELQTGFGIALDVQAGFFSAVRSILIEGL